MVLMSGALANGADIDRLDSHLDRRMKLCKGLALPKDVRYEATRPDDS